MKLTFFLGEFPTRSETFVLNQITGLLDRGHDVRILAFSGRQNTDPPAAVQRHDLRSLTTYVGIAPGWKSKLHWITDTATRAIRRPATCLSVLRYLLSTGSPEYKQILVTALGPRGPWRTTDCLICHYGPVGLVAAALKNLSLVDAPVVTVFHGWDASRYLEEHRKNVYEPLFETGDLFLPVSSFMKKRLMDHGAPADRTRVHHVGVDLDRFEPEGHPRRSEHVLLSVCRFVDKKGLDVALRACARLNEQDVPFEYRLVGNGPRGESLRRLAEELGIGGRVRFMGWRPPEDIPGLVRRADVFLAPSKVGKNRNEEGIPTAVMEAMASGIPVVSTRHAGLPELIEHEINGLLVEENETEKLAENVIELLNNPGLRNTMGRNARKKVSEEFNIRRQNERLETLLQSIGRK